MTETNDERKLRIMAKPKEKMCVDTPRVCPVPDGEGVLRNSLSRRGKGRCGARVPMDHTACPITIRMFAARVLTFVADDSRHLGRSPSVGWSRMDRAKYRRARLERMELL